MNYVYKIKQNLIRKNKENGDRKIELYGFNLYKDEEEKEEFYAIGIVLEKDNQIVVNAKKIIEYFYKNATEKQRKEDFSGWEFDENCELIFNEYALSQLTRTQLCFSLTGSYANALFINGTDGREYYGYEIIRDSAKEIIDYFLKANVIYRTRDKNSWKEVK